MKLLAFVLVLALGGTLGAQQRYITNDDIVRMSESGVSQDIIVKTIADSAIRFDVSPDCLIGLRKASVPDEIVRAMMARVREVQKAPIPAAPEPITGPSLAKFELDQPPATMPSLGVRTSAVAASPADKAEAGKTHLLPSNWSGNPELSAPALPTKTGETGNQWSLRPGHPEFAVSAGINSGPNRINSVGYAGIAGVALGINRYLAVFGSYGYNSLGSVHDLIYSGGYAYDTTVSGRLDEFVGGFRLSTPSRFSPYVEFGGGVVRASGKASVAGFSAGLGVNEPAFGGGVGMNFGLSRHFGANVDLRVLKASNLQVYGHVSMGVFSRF